MPRSTGAYLGQTPPGDRRQLFAPGVVSTERRELNAVFSPDGRAFFFSRDRAPGGTRILMTRLDAAGWQPAIEAPFSGGSDVDMFVSHDGSEVYFCSDRPTPGAPPATPPADTAVQTAMPAPADRLSNSRRFMSVVTSLRRSDCTRVTPRPRPAQPTPLKAGISLRHGISSDPQEATA